MRYSLTGATGFVGGVLARQLRETGHDVVALVRNPSRAGALADLGVELVPGDLDDLEALQRLCTGSDGFFHVAGWYKLGSRHPEQGRQVNVTGTRNALTAAQRAGVPRVVYTSTLAVNSDTHGAVVDESYHFKGTHLSVYDETKAAAHDVALRFIKEGLPLIIVMPGLVYGPGDTALTGEFIRNVAKGRRVMVPSGGGGCWGYVDDIAAGHVLAMERGVVGESYMLAGPRSSLVDGLRKVATVAGTKAPIAVPSAAITATAAINGVLGKVVPLPAESAAESLRASLATYFGLPAKAEAELGWSCRGLDEGIATTIRSL